MRNVLVHECLEIDHVFTPIAQGSSNLALSNGVLTDTAGQELLQPPAQISLTANSVTVIRVP